MYIIIFVRNPSLEDDSDEKVGLFLYPDNLEQTVASYRGRIKIRFLRNTLRSNLRSMSTIIFVRNPSLEDDSDEWRNLKPNNSPCFETKATNLNSTHFNITFCKKKNLASSCIWIIWNNPRRPTEDELKLKISTDTLIGNLRNMLNTLKIHDANHYKWVANSSDKANSANAHIKIVKYIFSNFSEKCLINLLIPILASIFTPKRLPFLLMYSSKN